MCNEAEEARNNTKLLERVDKLNHAIVAMLLIEDSTIQDIIITVAHNTEYQQTS